MHISRNNKGKIVIYVVPEYIIIIIMIVMIIIYLLERDAK